MSVQVAPENSRFRFDQFEVDYFCIGYPPIVRSMTKPERPLQLVSDVARRFGVVPATVRHWVRTGQLCAIRTERGYHLFHSRDVDAFAAARQQTATDAPVSTPRTT